ncbi:unnamed protein product [Ilex paraguariensis]|uniref:Glycosyltransferase family 28 N-terminal domain-containing protein n=1 Tax=Ilex paraguariensis TaxID=185542 RepID=A0ABC8UBN9_9AQUA
MRVPLEATGLPSNSSYIHSLMWWSWTYRLAKVVPDFCGAIFVPFGQGSILTTSLVRRVCLASLQWIPSSWSQIKLIEKLVKIQNDGTVKVDLTKSAPVASELLELHSVERAPSNIDYVTTDLNKSIPRLKIAMLVVGTRGDVQPFLAVAKRLQEFGHHVRLATHANFRSFVKSDGIDFYPLGGDPRVLAGYMARNKGFISSAPGEISIQRKQLKAIIESLLPACIEPDMETGEPFRAQAIIANPPAYGES